MGDAMKSPLTWACVLVAILLVRACAADAEPFPSGDSCNKCERDPDSNVVTCTLAYCPTVQPAPTVRASVPPDRNYDYDIYWEDPCVPAMRKAMQEMVPYLPTRFKQMEDGFYYFVLQLDENGRKDLEFAAQTWKDTELMCWRTQ